MADSKEEVASTALRMIGANSIASFSEATTEAKVVSALYEDVVTGHLSAFPWRFATNQVDLDHLSAAPTGRWGEAWQLPGDVLKLLAVTTSDIPIRYDRYGDKIFCEYDENSVLTADYIFRATEPVWSADFTLGIEFELASLFGASLRADDKLLDAFGVKASIQLKMARSNDSQQQTTRKIRTKRFISNRMV
jgi:hypothetical protein